MYPNNGAANRSSLFLVPNSKTLHIFFYNITRTKWGTFRERERSRKKEREKKRKREKERKRERKKEREKERKKERERERERERRQQIINKI